jgi:hypothetical protein
MVTKSVTTHDPVKDPLRFETISLRVSSADSDYSTSRVLPVQRSNDPTASSVVPLCTRPVTATSGQHACILYGTKPVPGLCQVSIGVFTLPLDPFGPVFGLDPNGPVGSIGSARKLHTPPLCGAYSTSSDPAGPLDPIGTDACFPTDPRIRG